MLTTELKDAPGHIYAVCANSDPLSVKEHLSIWSLLCKTASMTPDWLPTSNDWQENYIRWLQGHAGPGRQSSFLPP
ncbi:hypothetical protein WJX79_007508 [Trebouxia sp. C0005]